MVTADKGGKVENCDGYPMDLDHLAGLRPLGQHPKIQTANKGWSRPERLLRGRQKLRLNLEDSGELLRFGYSRRIQEAAEASGQSQLGVATCSCPAQSPHWERSVITPAFQGSCEDEVRMWTGPGPQQELGEQQLQKEPLESSLCKQALSCRETV